MACNLLLLVSVLLATSFTLASGLSIYQPPNLDCSAIDCKDIECDDDERPVIPAGECCPICRLAVDCSGMICPLVSCPFNQEFVVPEGECCGKCQIIDKCLGILCAFPQCALPVVPEGECCPQCPGCSAVLCLVPECEPGEILVTPEGECCPVCQQDCTVVLCALPLCKQGSIPEVPEGECCPVCVPDPSCAAVSCLLPVCPAGQVSEVPEGECCPVCVPDPSCAAVICLLPVCPAGQVSEVPEGECCPVCVCEIEGQTFSDCASACPRKCDQLDVLCRAQCKPGCQCPSDQVIDTANNLCVHADECPDQSCPIKGQTFSSCAGCDTTCNQFINKEIQVCLAVCREGCSCPSGQLIDTVGKQCFTPDECPNPCELVDCKPNALCKVFEETNEPFCEPSCSINNGGCPEDHICSLEEVQCVRAPCPPVVKCTDPCSECTDEQTCRLKTLPCLIPPCPVVAECLEPAQVCALPPDVGPCDGVFPRFFHNAKSMECESFDYGGCDGNENNFISLAECESKCENVVSPCATLLCPDGFRCEVFNNEEGFCQPDCSLDNGGCPEDHICSLKEVQCVRAPCPPVVKCTDPCSECTDEQTCRLKTLPCLIPPCPVVAECLEGCSLPPAVGPCKALIPRFFHNATSKECEKFIYGGCDGNKNNFNTLEECESKCKCKGAVSGWAVSGVYRHTDACYNMHIDPPNPCPEKCSKEFCSENPRATCSNPGPREIPGCTGSCQLSYCRACYVSEEPIVPSPGSCTLCNLSDYLSNTRCYRKWSRCTRRAHRPLYGKPDLNSILPLQCYSPPCPLKG